MKRLHLLGMAITLMLAAAAPAYASPVNIVFSFESFTSTLQSPNTPPTQTTLQSELKGTQDITSLTIPDTPFTVSGPFGESLSFQETTESGPQTANLVQFTPGPQANVVVGQEFLFGTFHLNDGIWFGNADIAFGMRTVSSDSSLNGFIYSDTLRMVLVPFDFADPKPINDADLFYLVNQRAAAPICAVADPNFILQLCDSLRVYELFDSPILPHVDGVSNAGSIELWGKIGSLDPLEFKNPQGGLFLSSSIGPDPGPILGQPTAVPEPSALFIFGSGLVALTIGVRRRTAALRCKI